jgi:hypothetical protein
MRSSIEEMLVLVSFLLTLEELIEELMKLDIHPILYNWINAFLSNRKQAVRIGGTLSDWKSPNGDIPQGTKLGVILFSIMTNKLISDWHLRTKFVDDTAALEIIPRNSMDNLHVRLNFNLSREKGIKHNS